MRPILIEEDKFIEEQSKIKGMNEHCARIQCTKNDLSELIYKYFNVGECPCTYSNMHRYLLY